jgi:hypothetical protein
LILAIVRNLPLRRPSILSARAVRRTLQLTGGITTRVFRMLNEKAIETGAEQITDDAVDRWHPAVNTGAAFS